MWQTFCEINRFKLVESKNKVIYFDCSASETIRSSIQALHIFKFAKWLQFDDLTYSVIDAS